MELSKLASVSNKEIFEELTKRFQGFVFSGIEIPDDNQKMEDTTTVMHGGTVRCLGLAVLVTDEIRQFIKDSGKNSENQV